MRNGSIVTGGRFQGRMEADSYRSRVLHKHLVRGSSGRRPIPAQAAQRRALYLSVANRLGAESIPGGLDA